MSVSWARMGGVYNISGPVCDRREGTKGTVESSRNGAEENLQFVDSFFTVFFDFELSSSATAVSIVFFIIVFVL
jgi:hypothetical protein